MRPRQKTLDAVTKLVRAATTIVGPKRATMMKAHLAEDLAPLIVQQTRYGEIRFLCPGKIPVYRARTLHTKEPETLRWIESLGAGEVFWDIGANVGLYSLYAAAKGHVVLAFEPSASNYQLLCRNAALNRLSHTVAAYCFAFTDATKLDSLYMSSVQIGAASNTFGETGAQQGGASAALSAQATLGFALDDFIDMFKPRFPNHLKIDVDGIELKIVQGAGKTLKDRRLKSILVEVDRNDKASSAALIKIFLDAGFSFVNEEGLSRSDGRRGFNVYNCIFARST